MSNPGPILVVLTGPIASGKSTVGRLAVSGTALAFLAEDVDSRAEDREVLARYYRAVEAYGPLRRADPSFAGSGADEIRETIFRTQVHFITRRSAILRRHLSGGESGGLSERHPMDDIEIFSRRNLEQGLLTPAQFADLGGLLERELAGIPPPALQIFLHCDPTRLRARIRRRGRPQEAELIRADNPYLEELGRLYAEWYQRYPGAKVLLRTDEIDEKVTADRVREEIVRRGLA